MANMPDSYFTLFHIKLSSSGTGANMWKQQLLHIFYYLSNHLKVN
jgi:hypothetical protein